MLCSYSQPQIPSLAPPEEKVGSGEGLPGAEIVGDRDVVRLTLPLLVVSRDRLDVIEAFEEKESTEVLD